LEDVIRRFRVFGKVQGVYFRHSTRLEARRLGIRGLARNLPDGSVEVLAQGSPASVESLKLWLHRGPSHARVAGVREIGLDEVELNTGISAAEMPIPEGFEVR